MEIAPSSHIFDYKNNHEKYIKTNHIVQGLDDCINIRLFNIRMSDWPIMSLGNVADFIIYMALTDFISFAPPSLISCLILLNRFFLVPIPTQKEGKTKTFPRVRKFFMRFRGTELQWFVKDRYLQVVFHFSTSMTLLIIVVSSCECCAVYCCRNSYSIVERIYINGVSELSGLSYNHVTTTDKIGKYIHRRKK